MSIPSDMNAIPRSHQIPALLLLCISGTLAACSNGQSDTLALSGTVEAREIALAFEVSGRIDKLHVDEGQAITQGQEVATLNAEDYIQAVARAKAEMDAAKAALAALEAGTRTQELEVAKASLTQAKAELRFATEELRRVRSLISKKLASQEQADQAQLRLDVASATVQQAQQQLKLLQEGPRSEDIDGARAKVAALQSALHTAERKLANTHLTSPASGLITLRQAEAGEVVAIGQTVFNLAKLSTPWVRAYINETDLPAVRLGQKAVVTVDGLPDHRFEGTLSFISPKAEFTPKSVETRELRVDLVYRVRIQLEDPDGLLKLGMPADVAFE